MNLSPLLCMLSLPGFFPAVWLATSKVYGAMRTKVKIRTAPGLLLSLMSIFGKSGVATPWGIIYVVPGRHRDRRLIARKMKRIEQLERRGVFVFVVLYLALFFRYGYGKHPFEIEVREAEDDSGVRIY